MAFATEYNLTFKDHFGTTWEVDIMTDGFSGAVTDLIGTGDPLFINYESNEIFTHVPIKASYAEINLIETTDDAYRELFIKDRTALVKIYKGINLYWQGWTIAEGYNSLYNIAPKSVKLLAVDGLTFLKNIPLDVDDMGGPDKYQVYKYFKEAFDAIGFGCSVYESFNILDWVSGKKFFTEFSIDSWRWYSKNGYSSLWDVLTDILTTSCARLFQKDGCWYINHISQLDAESITYNVYNSALAYTGTSAETINQDITSKSGSPMLVPINHSLYKEFDRPFSKFVLKPDYGLNKNLLRYPDVFTADCEFLYADDGTLRLSNDFVVPQLQGITYDLGYIDMGVLPIGEILDITISGKCRGYLTFKLILYNIADSKNYYYQGVKVLEEEDYEIGTWNEYYTGSGNRFQYIIFVNHSSSSYLEDFNETVKIANTNSALKGNLKLLINTPTSSSFPQFSTPVNWTTMTYAVINVGDITVNYLECNKDSYSLALTNSELNINEKEYSVKLYSNPSLYYIMELPPVSVGWMDYDALQKYVLGYINPNLAYPGLFYQDSDENGIYTPIVAIKLGSTGDGKTIEQFITEDIMTYYSVLRNKIIGTLLGQIDFGKCFEYDSKRYIPVSIIMNVKKSQNDVVMLQVSEVESYLLNEDDSYILYEDGNNIQI